MRGREPGPQPNRLAKVVDRLVDRPQVDEGCAEITVELGMIGLERQRGAVALSV